MKPVDIIHFILCVLVEKTLGEMAMLDLNDKTLKLLKAVTVTPK